MFNQPSSSSIAINNILDQSPSQLLGSLSANGRIVLLNPNGFYIGENASISANTFIAAASSLSNSSYNSFNNTLSTTPLADIINKGAITTTNKTQLIAKNISTNGTLSANNVIALTATQSLTIHGAITANNNNSTQNSSIDLFSDGSIRGSASTTATTTTINAEGQLSLSGNHDATTLILQGSPILIASKANLNADTLTIHSDDSYALISATINATTQTYTAGTSLSFLNASLTSDAGDITIGNKTTPTITIDQNTTISSNAVGNNDAGSIIIFSSSNTSFYGTATATATHGNGGFIELSSKGSINHSTPLNISTTSIYGKTGTLLIDPDTIIIVDGSGLNTFNHFQALLTAGTKDDSNIPSPQGSALFGNAVALTETYALIGANGYDFNGVQDTGNAWLYNLTTNTWIDLLSTNNAPSLKASAFFGGSVALSNDYALIGEVFIGSPTDGGAYLYELADADNDNFPNEWSGNLRTSAISKLSAADAPGTGESFGISVALNDTYALIGANGSSTTTGAGYLLNLTNPDEDGDLTDWKKIVEPGVETGAGFGRSVALNSDYAVIGATSDNSGRGGAYLYKLDDKSWTDLSDAGLGSDADDLDSFGISVAINEGYVLIGDEAYDVTIDGDSKNEAGNAFLYNIADGSWTNLLEGTTSGINPSTLTDFGVSVALNETHAIIGDDLGNLANGAAWLYNLSDSTWTDIVAEDDDLKLGILDSFGISVAISSTHFLVGSEGADVGGVSNTGQAYLFNLAEDVDDPEGTQYLTSYGIVDALAYNNVVHQADDGIEVRVSLDLSGVSNTLTLRAPSIAFADTPDSVVIGSEANPLIIESGSDTDSDTTSDAWSSSTLTLPTSGSVYLSAASGGVLGILSDGYSGVFQLTQTVGDLNVASDVTTTADIALITTGSNADITLGGNTISANSIRLSAAGIIVGVDNGSLNAPSILLEEGGTLNIDSVAVDEKGGALSSLLDGLFGLFGSGCDKDDVFTATIGVFGLLCGKE